MEESKGGKGDGERLTTCLISHLEIEIWLISGQIWCFTFEIWSDMSDSMFHIWNLRVCKKIVLLISHIHRCWTLECAWFPGIVSVIVRSWYLILITNGVSHYNLFQQTLHFIGDCLSLNQSPSATFPAGRFEEFSIFLESRTLFPGRAVQRGCWRDWSAPQNWLFPPIHYCPVWSEW